MNKVILTSSILIPPGYGEGYTDIVFKGSTKERKFLAFYIK